MHAADQGRRRISAEELSGQQRLRLTVRLLRDARVPGWLKLLVPTIAAIYVMSPIDVIPDVILGLGQIDDLGVIGIAVMILLRLLPRWAPAEVVDEHIGEITRPRRRHSSHGRKGPVIDTSFEIVDPSKQR